MTEEASDFHGRIGVMVRVHRIVQHNPRSWWGATACGQSGVVREIKEKNPSPLCKQCFDDLGGCEAR